VIYAVTIGGFLLVSGFFLLGIAFGKMIGRRQVYEEWLASLERERLERSRRCDVDRTHVAGRCATAR